VIGIPAATPPGTAAESGAVLVLRGGAAHVVTAGRRLLWPDLPSVPGRSEGNASFGASVAVENLDGNRRGDLAIGAPSARPDRPAPSGCSTAVGADPSSTAPNGGPSRVGACPELPKPGTSSATTSRSPT
jgi:hypothetical protein